MVELDLKDRKILYEMDRNSRASLQEIGKNVRLSKEVVFHRINKLVDEGVIINFLTVPATYRFGLTGYKVYLRLTHATKENLDSFIEYLKNEKSVYYTNLCKGRWDLIFGIWAETIFDFFYIYNKVLNKFSTFIQEKDLSITVENIQFNRRWFYSDNKPRVEFTFGEKEEKLELDKKDMEILDIITNNSRMKIINISKKTRLNPKVIAYRIKEMEKKKIIRGYKLFINSDVVGYSTYKSFVYFKNINEKRKNEFIEYCKNLPNIINIVLTFAPWDLEMMFETKEDKEYYKIMEDIKEKFKDIFEYYESILILAEPRHKYLINKNKI